MVTKNGDFEVCSNRTCNYRKEIKPVVSENEDNNQ